MYKEFFWLMNGSDQPIHSCDSDTIDPQKVLYEGHLHSEHSEITLNITLAS